MNIERFQELLKPVTDFVSSQIVSPDLAEELNRRFPHDGVTFRAIEAACHEAILDGWMCVQGKEGRRFGRIIEPGKETGRLSVDVVDLKNIVGPHHRHPTGEICMIMPVTEGAQFDGKPRGWCVFEPGSDHRPTVTNGEALVLYMLPEGKIEFTEQ
ncbi:MAG: DUF4863 family protein [Gammaproteobacteria bacterium]|nr:MAG: DUF4863 family protein [Gammaproteobacteria bacterium]